MQSIHQHHEYYESDVSGDIFPRGLDPTRDFHHRYVRIERPSDGGDPITVHYIDQPPEEQHHSGNNSGGNNTEPPCIVLIHGWPDLWYGWRYQIRALSKAGYRVLVPDLPGFGSSSIPKEIEAYTWKNLASDVIALLDANQIQKAVVIGHDWGGVIAWRLPLYFPDRILAVGAIGTPYTPPRRNYLSVEDIVRVAPMYKYQIYLSDEEKPAKELEADPEFLFRFIFRKTRDGDGELARNPFFLSSSADSLLGFARNDPQQLHDLESCGCILSQSELDYYVQQFRASGFQYGLNLYRNRLLNYRDELEFCSTDNNNEDHHHGNSNNPNNNNNNHESPFPRTVIHHPALMVTVGRDPILTPEQTKHMEAFIPKNLCRAHIPDAGHWPTAEQPEELNKILLGWLKQVVVFTRRRRIAPASQHHHNDYQQHSKM